MTDETTPSPTPPTDPTEVASPAAAPPTATAADSVPARESSSGAAAEPKTQPFSTPQFDAADAGRVLAGIEVLDDVELNVKVELGRAEMYIEDVLRLGPGSVVQLDKLAGDSVDVFVNEQLVARGEVLVLNENFCVRVNEIVSSVGELDAAK